MEKIIPVLPAAMAAVSLSACAAKTVTEAATAVPAATEAPAETSADTREEIEAARETRAEGSKTGTAKEATMTHFAEFPDDKHMIAVPDLFEKIDTGEDVFTINIGRPEDYTQGHLKGAANLPCGVGVADNLNKIPDDIPVYVNCYTGQTSSQTVTLLNVAGKYATSIQNGWNSGISQTGGYEAYINTEETALPQGTYEVDPAALEAIAAYYKETTSNTISFSNFKPESLMELVDAENEDYTVLSVYQAEGYAKGHIAGAINVPFARGMQEQFSQIPTGRPVVVYCYTGQTPSQTTAVLHLLGYEAYSLQSGMDKEGGAEQLDGGYSMVTEQLTNR